MYFRKTRREAEKQQQRPVHGIMLHPISKSSVLTFLRSTHSVVSTFLNSALLCT